MARVLTDTEIREVCDLLIPIIRMTAEGDPDSWKIPHRVINSNSNRAKVIWKLITYEDYAGELV